jgi:hypothetical protein
MRHTPTSPAGRKSIDDQVVASSETTDDAAVPPPWQAHDSSPDALWVLEPPRQESLSVDSRPTGGGTRKSIRATS